MQMWQTQLRISCGSRKALSHLSGPNRKEKSSQLKARHTMSSSIFKSVGLTNLASCNNTHWRALSLPSLWTCKGSFRIWNSQYLNHVGAVTLITAVSPSYACIGSFTRPQTSISFLQGLCLHADSGQGSAGWARQEPRHSQASFQPPTGCFQLKYSWHS